MTALAYNTRPDLAKLVAESRTSTDARLILADAFDDMDRHDVAMLYRDEH